MVCLNAAAVLSVISLSILAYGFPTSEELQRLEGRESACVALNTCPGDQTPPESSPAAPTTTTAASETPTPAETSAAAPTLVAPTNPPSNETTLGAPQRQYVAFGDSYAAGIGTGTTDTDSCRKGEFSYPKLLASISGPNVDFQNLPCSGAIVGDVSKSGGQIDQWTNPQNADVATVSIGGNDIGFYNILTACILRVGQAFAGDCDKVVAAASTMIAGPTLASDIRAALLAIFSKANQTGFRIYMTGYPTFFNPTTDSCDYTTFYYWQPGHHGFHRPGNWAYLYKNLRTQVNELVSDLNIMLGQVASTLAGDGYRIAFIDPNNAYSGHRFCEDGVTEPDSSRDDTWLFLSGWGDNSIDGTASASDAAAQDASALSAGNTTAYLPDASSCAASLAASGSHDWYDQMLCEMSEALANPQPTDGANNATTVWESDQAKIAAGDYSTQEVPAYIATRTAKTFHPKSLGQKAYADAIAAIW